MAAQFTFTTSSGEGAVLMDMRGEQFLTRAGFADQQHARGHAGLPPRRGFMPLTT
jgi:hypothetical protein